MSQTFSRTSYATLTLVLGVVILLGVVAWLREMNRVYNLTLTAGQEGGMYLPLAHSLKELIELKNSKIRVEVIESMGSGENLKRLASGEADLALAQNDTVGNDKVRTITPLYRGILHFVVRKNSSIQNLQDLRGKRVAWGLDGSGSRPIAEDLLAHYEIGESDVNLIPMKIGQACDALRANEIDAMLLMVGLHSKAVRELAKERKIQFVSLGEGVDEGSEIEGFRMRYPFAQGYLVPTFAYASRTPSLPGVPEKPVSALSIKTLFLSREDLPKHIARSIAETIHQNRSTLLQNHPSAAEITEDFEKGALQFPVHPGAEQFYLRDEPGWMATYADLLGFVFSILFAIGGFCAAALQWWTQNKKDRIDEYYLKIDGILDKIQNPKITRKRLKVIDEDLNRFRRETIRQLADEKLVPDESFRIFQTLLRECRDAVDQRLSEVQK